MEGWCCQLVKIESARDAFASVVAPIPISGTSAAIIETCGLNADRKRPNQHPGCVINGYRYWTLLRKLIGNPRLRVKRIRVVLQQLILLRFADSGKPNIQNRVWQVLRRHVESQGMRSNISIGTDNA